MKIAIQGHVDRGKEIIQILESLGGINDGLHEGNNPDCYYELHGNSIWCVSTKGINFKYYTLEEFEKEFPFKIGDKIMDCSDNEVGTIIDLIYIDNGFFYNVDFVNSGQAFMPSEQLKPYKEMKEERNITLTLEKAKEWYNKGGDLKQVALQAFTEEELTKVGLPKTWEEFCNNHPTKRGEYYIDSCSEINSQCESNGGRDIEMDKNVCPSKKSAEAHLAMIQLEQLRDCYRGLFVTVIGMPVWNISRYDGKPHIFQAMWGKNHSFLSFQSKEVAEEYLKNFKPLIEQAGDLI